MAGSHHDDPDLHRIVDDRAEEAFKAQVGLGMNKSRRR
jgi:hypothetical protein